MKQRQIKAFYLFVVTIAVLVHASSVQALPSSRKKPNLIASQSIVSANVETPSGVSLKKRSSIDDGKAGLHFSDENKECFWTKPVIKRNDCFNGLPSQPTDSAQDLTDKLCERVSLKDDLEQACLCVESKHSANINSTIKSPVYKSTDVMDQDNYRRGELKENIFKVFIREHVFDKGITSCNLDSRFKEVVKISEKKQSNPTLRLAGKEHFCGDDYSPFREMGIFQKIEKERLPRLNFEHTIRAGIDLIKSFLPDSSDPQILKTIRAAKRPDKYNAYIRKTSSDVKVAIKTYFSERNSFIDFQKNECHVVVNQKGYESKIHYPDLCNLLGKLGDLGDEQRRGIEIALELITENPGIMQETISNFIDGTAGLYGEKYSSKIEQIAQKRADELKIMISANHQKFCDNIIGDKDREPDKRIDSVRRYCSNEEVYGLKPTDESIEETVKSLESDSSEDNLKRATLAKFKYCSSIRARLEEAKNKLSSTPVSESDKVWIEEFKKNYNISEACFTTDKKIAHNGLSDKMVAGVVPKPLTETQQYFQIDNKPNLFSGEPYKGIAFPKYESKGSSAYFANDNIPSIGNSTSQMADTDNGTTVIPIIEKDQPMNAGSFFSDESVNGSSANLPQSAANASRKNNMLPSREEQSAINEFRSMDPQEQINAIKNSTNDDMLEKILDKMMQNKISQQDEEQQKVIEALKKRIDQLEKEKKEEQNTRSIASVQEKNPPHNSSGIFGIGNPLGTNVNSPRVNNTAVSSAPPSRSTSLGDGVDAGGNSYKTPITLSSSSRGSSKGPGRVLNSGMVPAGLQVEEVDTNGDNSADLLRLSQEEFGDIPLGVSEDKVTQDKDNATIEVQLVDCKAQTETRQTKKGEACVLLSSGEIVTLSYYLNMLKEKKDKLAWRKDNQVREPASTTEKTKPQRDPKRHKSLVEGLE